MFSSSLALALTLIPSLVSAGMYPPKGPVKMLEDQIFRKSMTSDRTAVVAFVAPWCGHCQKLTPEYSKAAQSLSPLIDFYAVDCDADVNKRLCAEQGIKGFPTIKSFPRGATGATKEYQGERKASSIVAWAGGEVPMRVTNLKTADAVSTWASKTHPTEPRALLLTKAAKVPVMWKVLASRYNGSPKIAFGAIKDESGDIAKGLGLPESDSKSRVALWKKGDDAPTVYEGALKFESLSTALKAIRVEGESFTKDEL